MDRQEVKSSQIRSIGYNPETKVLEMQFTPGSVYTYDRVPVEKHIGLMMSDSKGKYFAENIKCFPELYPFTRIRGTDREEAKKAYQMKSPQAEA